MRNSFALVLVMFIGTSFGNAQGIVNTERMLTNAGDSLTLSLEIAGDLSLGNVSLLQVDTQLSSGIRKGNHLYRALFGYDFYEVMAVHFLQIYFISSATTIL